MSNPFEQLAKNHQQEDTLALARPAVPWFEINSLDSYNMRAHMEQSPSQCAYVQEQESAWEKKYNDAKGETKAAHARAYLKAKEEPLSRHSLKGGMEEVNTTDGAASAMADCDPDYLATMRYENECKYYRDLWRGYGKAHSAKKMMLACLSGINREELKFLGIEQ